jgi:LysM repeat protein
MPGWADVGAKMEWATAGGGARRFGGTIAGWNDFLGLGMEFASKNRAGRTKGGSLGGWIKADRKVVDLGPTQKEAGSQSPRRLELTHLAGGGGVGGMGISTALLGVGGTLGVAKTKEVVYRTEVDAKKSATILFEKKGFAGFVKGFAKDKARALGKAKEMISIPALTEPEKLKVGDELVVSTSGSIRLGIAVGGMGARVGVAGLARGEFDLAVRRIDENQVELVCTPTQIRALNAFADLPFIFDMRAGKAWAKAFRQSFVFDLREPEAKAAYLQALKGDLPEGLSQLPENTGEASMDLADVVSSEKLSKGVKRTHLEKVDVKRDAKHVGLTWGPFHDLWGVAGLGVAHANTRSVREVTDGQSVFITESRGVEKKRDVLISGTESTGILASLKRATHFDAQGNPQTRFLGLELKGILTDDNVRGFELNNEVVDKLNLAFGLSLLHFTVKGDKKERRVTIGQELKSADLARMTQNPEAEVKAIADRIGVKASDLKKLVGQLTQEKDPAGRARLVQAFVADEGLGGLGCIFALAGKKPTDLKVSTWASAYEEPAAKANLLALKYQEPVAGNASNADLSKRFSDVDKAMEKLREASALAADDPLIETDMRTRVMEQAKKDLLSLSGLLSLNHLSPPQRLSLFSQLDQGWTTGGEARVMRALEEAGLPA